MNSFQPRPDRLEIDFIQLGSSSEPWYSLQELLAAHAVAFGQAQQPAFVLHQALVDVVELLDQRLDARRVERQRLHRRDQLVLELLVAALLAGRQRAGRGQPVLDLLVLQLAQLLVGVGDDVEGRHHLRAQLRLPWPPATGLALVLVLFLVLEAAAFAADIGDVVVVARASGVAFSSTRGLASASSMRSTTGACLASGPA